MSSEAEHSPSQFEALGSISSTVKTKQLFFRSINSNLCFLSSAISSHNLSDHPSFPFIYHLYLNSHMCNFCPTPFSEFKTGNIISLRSIQGHTVHTHPSLGEFFLSHVYLFLFVVPWTVTRQILIPSRSLSAILQSRETTVNKAYVCPPGRKEDVK